MSADEENILNTLRACREVVGRLNAAHHGQVFSSAGDSVVVDSPTVVEEVDCVVETPQEMEVRNGFGAGEQDDRVGTSA